MWSFHINFSKVDTFLTLLIGARIREFLLAVRKHKKLGITLFSHLHKNFISGFDFLSLKSNFSSFLTIFRILSPYVDRIIAAIDFVLGKRILARNKNKNKSTATRKNILNFQFQKAAILNLWRNLCWQTVIPSNDILKKALYHFICEYSDVDKIIKIDLRLSELVGFLISWFFIEDMLIFLFYSNQPIISKNFVTTLILVIRTCPFHFVTTMQNFHVICQMKNSRLCRIYLRTSI